MNIPTYTKLCNITKNYKFFVFEYFTNGSDSNSVKSTSCIPAIYIKEAKECFMMNNGLNEKNFETAVVKIENNILYGKFIAVGFEISNDGFSKIYGIY